MGWNKDPSALGILITLIVYSVIFMIITILFIPALAMFCLLAWVLLFAVIMLYDRRHWGVPGPETQGIWLSSKTRKLDIGEYSIAGVVMGTCVKTRNLFSSARAESRAIVGGEALQFSSLVEECRNIAMNRMCQKARNLGCNGIIGLRLITAETLWGATELIAYGTAVRIRRLENA